MRKLIFLSLILVIVFAQGCVKTTVDLDKVSGQVYLAPGFVIAAVKGDVTLGDIVEANDTIMFDDLGLMKIVFSEDSIINYGVSNFYSSFPAGTYSELFPLVPPTVEVAVDTVIDIDPGSGIEIKEMSIITGDVDYTITSTCTFNTLLRIEFPSIDDGGSPLVDTIFITGAETKSGQINIDNVLADLTSDVTQPYNRFPISFRIIPQGIVSDPFGSVNVEVSMAEPEFDYLKGFFGTMTEESGSDTIDLGMEELFENISGSFGISNPIITVNYKNSFSIPLEVEALITGRNSTQEIDLDRDPVDLEYPLTMDPRDISASFTIDKNNSSLPALVSMLPNEITFAGSAIANPDGDTGTDNVIFGDSRFMADVEVEVPMEFWINNLQLTDTVDNFFLSDGEDESPLDMLNSVELRLYINNGFPLGGSVSISLYDSVNAIVMSTLTTGDFFEPAEVDASGQVTASVEKSTIIEMTEDFLEAAETADKMIMTFTLYTTNNGSQDVKIYSDYSIVFKAGLAFRAEIDANLNEDDNE